MDKEKGDRKLLPEVPTTSKDSRTRPPNWTRRINSEGTTFFPPPPPPWRGGTGIKVAVPFNKSSVDPGQLFYTVLLSDQRGGTPSLEPEGRQELEADPPPPPPIAAAAAMSITTPKGEPRVARKPAQPPWPEWREGDCPMGDRPVVETAPWETAPPQRSPLLA